MKYTALLEAALHAPPAVTAAVAALRAPSHADIWSDVELGERHVAEVLRRRYALAAPDAQGLAAALTRRFPRPPAKVTPSRALVALLRERLGAGWTARALADTLSASGVPISAAALHALAAIVPGVYPAPLAAALGRLQHTPVLPDDQEGPTPPMALRRVGPPVDPERRAGALHPLIRRTGERLTLSLDAWLTDPHLPATAEVLAVSEIALATLRVLFCLTPSSSALSTLLHDLASHLADHGEQEIRGLNLLSVLALPEADVLAALSGVVTAHSEAPVTDLRGRQVLLVGGDARSAERRRVFEAISGAALTFVPLRRHRPASWVVSSVRRADVVVIRSGLVSHAASAAVVREAIWLGVPVTDHDGAVRAERLVAEMQDWPRAGSLSTFGAS